MDEVSARSTTQISRSQRSRRILERLAQGGAYGEIAREEGLTERRVRQIVAERLKRRAADESGTHANLQIDRLGFAMRVAGEALARGDVRAIAPFIKVVDRLDRYQALAQEAAPRRTAADDLVMRLLIERFRRGYVPAPAEAPPHAAADPAASDPVQAINPAEPAPAEQAAAEPGPTVDAAAASPTSGPAAAPSADRPVAIGAHAIFFPFTRP
jgi:hypothetical protein